MTTSETENEVCSDCGARVSEGRDGCRKLFEELLARDFSDYRYGRTHRLMVDAYSLQHPDAYMRSGKSFFAHLTGICAALEFDDAAEINQSVQRFLNGKVELEKPASIPDARGELNVTHVHRASTSEEHNQRVLDWARSTWAAWSEHHDLARRWINQALTMASV